MAQFRYREEYTQSLRQVQDTICQFLVAQGNGQMYKEDLWDYEKGEGGGVTRVWEGSDSDVWEKAGVNFSCIVGPDLPAHAQKQFNVPPNTPFLATGVSLVVHPRNPNLPTVHMNIRYFETGERWWFGGGIDVTPYYPNVRHVIQFHSLLQYLCTEHKQDYNVHKRTCDEYFMLPHRGETRGVSGLFFDTLSGDRDGLLKFILALGNAFPRLYSCFFPEAPLWTLTWSPEQRDFQLYRRGRYVEFNLIYDRGTKFGLVSNGRVESIFMSLPAVAHWRYAWAPQPGTAEASLYQNFLKPRDWLNLSAAELIVFGEAPQPRREGCGHTNTRGNQRQSWIPVIVSLSIGVALGYALATRTKGRK